MVADVALLPIIARFVSTGREIVTLRSCLRHRQMLIEYAAAHIQHMQKDDETNLQLHHVIADITGLTGMRIIRAIVDSGIGRNWRA